jgi:hypothetical protein
MRENLSVLLVGVLMVLLGCADITLLWFNVKIFIEHVSVFWGLYGFGLCLLMFGFILSYDAFKYDYEEDYYN